MQQKNEKKYTGWIKPLSSWFVRRRKGKNLLCLFKPGTTVNGIWTCSLQQFLSLGITDIWGRITPCYVRGGLPALQDGPQSLTSLHQVPGAHTLLSSPCRWWPKMFPHRRMFLGDQNQFWLRTTGLAQRRKFWGISWW